MTFFKIAAVLGSIISAYFFNYFTSIDIPKPEDILHLFLWLGITIFLITATALYIGRYFLCIASIIFLITFIICRVFWLKKNKKL